MISSVGARGRVFISSEAVSAAVKERLDPCARRRVEVPEYALLLDARWEKCLIKDNVPGAEEPLGLWVKAYPALVATGKA
jgi:hypothetical protein